MSIPQENIKDNMRAESTTNKKGDYTHELTKWGLIILVIWLAYMFAHHLVPFFFKDWLPDIFRDNKGQFQIGTFGDYFGALNTLFAGLAFAGIIVTIRQQSKDLEIQTKSINATKEEIYKQTLESSFFSYLGYMNSVKPKAAEAYIGIVNDNLKLLRKALIKYRREIEHKSGGLEKAKAEERIIFEKINNIRKILAIFATWRRAFYSWYIRVESSSFYYQGEEYKKAQIANYVRRFWHMLSQDERRLLFLQTAFCRSYHEKEWQQHRELFQDSMCIANFFKSWTKKDFNVLMALLHQGSYPPHYPIGRIETMRNLLRTVYELNECEYEKPVKNASEKTN